MSHPSLQLPRKEEKRIEKIVKSPKETVDVKVIVETLRKLKEQIDIFPEFYKSLDNIDVRLERIEAQYELIISLLKSKVDLDAQEAEIMALLKKKIEKGK